MTGVAPAWTDPAADPIRDLRAAVAEFLRAFGWRPRVLFQANALRAFTASRALQEAVSTYFHLYLPAWHWPVADLLRLAGDLCGASRVGVLAPASDHVRPDPRLPCLTLDTGAGLVWLLPED